MAPLETILKYGIVANVLFWGGLVMIGVLILFVFYCLIKNIISNISSPNS